MEIGDKCDDEKMKRYTRTLKDYFHRIRGEGWQCNTCGLILTARGLMLGHSKMCKRSEMK